MIKFTATLPVYSLSDIIQVNENFHKRELVLCESWRDRDGNQQEVFLCIEFTNDRISLINQFTPGQTVNVEGMIVSRPHNGRYFTTLRGLNAFVVQQQAQATQGGYQQSQPTQQVYPQQSQGYPQTQTQLSPAPQQGYPQAQQAQGYPQQQQSPWIAPGVHQTAYPHQGLSNPMYGR